MACVNVLFLLVGDSSWIVPKFLFVSGVGRLWSLGKGVGDFVVSSMPVPLERGGFVGCLSNGEKEIWFRSCQPTMHLYSLSSIGFFGATAGLAADVVLEIVSVWTYEEEWLGYDSQLILFFATFGMYVPDIDQEGNGYRDFTELVVGPDQHKIYSSDNHSIDHTWADTYTKTHLEDHIVRQVSHGRLFANN